MKFFVLMLCTCIALGPVSAIAQTRTFEELSEPEKKELARLVEDGKKTYNEGEFQKSLELFGQAYDLYSHPDILYRLGLCYERLGDDSAAVRHYRQFLVEVPDAPERPRIEKTIQVIEDRIARSTIQITTIPEGAVVYVDDRANGPAGLTPTQLPIKPGNYKIIVKKEGFDAIEELVTVKPGATVQLRYQLIREPEVVAPKDTISPHVLPIVGLTTLGIGAGIAGFVFFSSYSDDVAQLERYDELRIRNPQLVTRTQYENTKSSRNTNLGLALGFTGLGVGSLVGAYLVWKFNQEDGTARLDVGWQDGPNVGLTTTF